MKKVTKILKRGGVRGESLEGVKKKLEAADYLNSQFETMRMERGERIIIISGLFRLESATTFAFFLSLSAKF